MSYLDFPRFCVAGQFFTDPSTVDNDPQHYDPKVTNPSPWQEPRGLHYFQFRGCQVVNAFDSQGKNAASDPIVGLNLTTTDNPSPAKIVDLDVYQQGISTIFGLQAQLTFDDGSSIVGDIDPCALNSVWFNAVLPERGWNQDYGWGSPGGDFNASGYYQSVIRFDQASFPKGKSAILDQLVSKSVVENGKILFSIRFVVDGYDNVSGGYIDGDLTRPVNQGFRLGRFSAAIGPQLANDPIQAPGPRWLLGRVLGPGAQWNDPSLNNIPFQFNAANNILSIDLANGVCRTYPGGPPCDLGTIEACVQVPGTTFVDVATFQFTDLVYNSNSGIVDIAVTNSGVAELLTSNPFVLRSTSGIIFQEAKDGVWFAADNRSLRMTSEPGSQWSKLSTRVRVWKFGVPQANYQLGVQVVPVHGNTPGATVPPTNPGDTPQADGALGASVTPTDANGWAVVNLSALKDPGYRTIELDGQLYFLWLYAGSPPPATSGAFQEQTVSTLLWSSYTVNTNPPWELIQAMMAPYMKLFPGMKDKIDLTDENTFFIFGNNPPWVNVYGPNTPSYCLDGTGPNCDGGYSISKGAIGFYMTRDFNDPRFMPLSRDLSPNKLKTVLYYIKKIQQQPVPPAQESNR